MNVYASQKIDDDGVVEAIAAVAEPTTDPASVSALPIVKKKGRNQVPYNIYCKKKVTKKTYLLIDSPIRIMIFQPT
jgi:hypothetical protein